MGNPDGSERLIKEAAGKFPGTAEGLVIRGLLSGLSTADPTLPADFFSEAIELDPTCSPAYYYRGLEYFSAQQYPAAIRDFTRCMDLDVLNIECLISRSEAYAGLENYQAAIQDLIEFGRRRGKMDPWIQLQIAEYMGLDDPNVDGMS